MFSVPDRNNPGVSVIPLFRDSNEEVSIQEWEPNAEVSIDAAGGVEVLVLNGSFTEGGDELVKHSWLRVPVGQHISALAGVEGAKVWIKRGHLTQIDRDLENLAQG